MQFKPFANIVTDKSLIFEFEDGLPLWLVTSGENQLKTLAFEYGHHAKDFDDGNPYFGRILLLRERNIDLACPYIIHNLIDFIRLDLLGRLDPCGKFVGLQRIAVNGQLPTQQPSKHLDHDLLPDMWTAVYYANCSDGDTLFFDSLIHPEQLSYQSSFKQGKIVIFPSYFLHQAMSPTKNWRITIGITFEWITELSRFKRDYV